MAFEMEEMPWPKKGDKPFVSGDVPSTQAWVNWMAGSGHSDMISEGFRKAADYVVEKLENDPEYRYADLFFAPVGFLYRHFLELSMKSVIEQGIKLSLATEWTDEEKKQFGHNLHKLWNKVRPIIEGMNEGADPEPMLVVERVILDFHKIDKSGQEFRYAITTNNKPSLSNAPDKVCLSNLRKTMDAVGHFFDGIVAQLDHCDPGNWC